MGLIIGGVSARDLILDGHSVSLYAGGSPPVKVWPTSEVVVEVVQITLGSLYQARDQLRAALSDRGLGYQTVTEIPFEIELVGSGSARNMFDGCSSLTHAPALETSSVRNMSYMFRDCAALTHVPDMDTAQVTDTGYMFYNCPSLTDGNVRLIGKNAAVTTAGMINSSGLTRLPFFDTDGNPI